MENIFGAFEAASSTPKPAPAIKAVKVPCEAANALKRLKPESDAAKPSVHRENVMAPAINAIKAAKVPCERTNPTKPLKKEFELAPTNIALHSFFVQNLGTGYIACNVGGPSMLCPQVLYFACVLDSCSYRGQCTMY